LSWDRRIRALPPASRLSFDARAWSAKLTTTPVEYCAAAGSPQHHRQSLHTAIVETFRALELDTECGVLALSGGYDSRMILLMLQGRRHLKTVTWGHRAALADRRTDASIAQRLAAKVGAEHSYYELDLAANDVRTVLDRFVRLSEGRTDQISGYTDGFVLWKRLRERGVGALFRGDEAFGCRAAANDGQVYRNMRCTVLADFRVDWLDRIADVLPVQQRPRYLERREGESLPAWRDRLNAEFELPYLIAPLNDLKVGYVDIVHPFISHRIAEHVRALPDELRTDKAAFKSLVEATPLGVPFASRTAIPPPSAVLREPPVLHALRRALGEQREGSGAAATLADHALALLPATAPQAFGISTCARRLVARAWPQRFISPAALGPPRLALRTYIIGKMQTLLEEDARAARYSGRGP
jgi:hypothetical protein